MSLPSFLLLLGCARTEAVLEVVQPSVRDRANSASFFVAVPGTGTVGSWTAAVPMGGQGGCLESALNWCVDVAILYGRPLTRSARTTSSCFLLEGELTCGPTVGLPAPPLTGCAERFSSSSNGVVSASVSCGSAEGRASLRLTPPKDDPRMAWMLARRLATDCAYAASPPSDPLPTARTIELVYGMPESLAAFSRGVAELGGGELSDFTRPALDRAREAQRKYAATWGVGRCDP